MRMTPKSQFLQLTPCYDNFNMQRDDNWLNERFLYLKDRFFLNIPIINKITIKFGRPCKTRLGSIKQTPNKKESIITINGYLKDYKIPGYVIDAVLMHEFTHYTHGFGSPHKQKYSHPHKHNVVGNELKNRGLAEILQAEKRWIKINWIEYLKSQKHKFL